MLKTISRPAILVRATHKKCKSCHSDVADYGHSQCLECCSKGSSECQYFKVKLLNQKDILKNYYPSLFKKIYK